MKVDEIIIDAVTIIGSVITFDAATTKFGHN